MENVFVIIELFESWSKLEEIYSSFLLAKLNFFDTLSKPPIKGLITIASTVAVVELLKQDYSIGVSALYLISESLSQKLL